MDQNTQQDKQFKEFLEKIVEQNKLVLASELIQTKTDRDLLKIEKQEYNVPGESVEKTLVDSKKLLSRIEKHLENTSKTYKKTNDKVIDKLGDIANQGIERQGFKKSAEGMADDRPLTMREMLKGSVATIKEMGNKLAERSKSTLQGIKQAVTSPIETLDKAHASVSSKIKAGIDFSKDILTTDPSYSIEGERSAKARMASGKGYEGGIQKGIDVFNTKQIKEQQIADIRKKEAIQKTYGFNLSEKDRTRLKTVEQEHSEIDILPTEIEGRKLSGKDQRKVLKRRRQNEIESGRFLEEIAPVRTKSKSPTPQPVSTQPVPQPVPQLVSTQPVQPAKESEAQKQAEKNVEAKRQENPEADNIRSAQEIIADNTKEDIQLTRDLLETTKESVTILKDIRQSLADQIQPLRSKEQPIAPQETDKDSSGSLLGNAADLLSNLPGKSSPGKPIPKPSGKPSLGGRIMGGIKSAGPGLLKGGAAALGGIALGYGAEKLIESGHEKVGGAVDVGAEALSGAGMGAMIGSIVPGIGTGIGAAIGGVAGGAYGLYKNMGNLFGGNKKAEVGGKRKYEEEADKIAQEELKKGADPLNLQNLISDRLQDKYPKEDLEIIQFAAEKAADKANKTGYFAGESKPTTEKQGGSDKIKVGKKEYTPDELDQAVRNKEVSASVAFNARKEFRKDSSEAYNKETEKRINADAKPKDENLKDYTKDPKYQKLLQEEQEVIKGRNVRTAGEGREASETLSVSQVREAEREAKTRYLEQTGPKPKPAPNVTPVRKAPSELGDLSVKYNDETREAAQSKPTPAPIIMNNSSNNSSTQIMPMKADPRSSTRGSALEKYMERTTTY